MNEIDDAYLQEARSEAAPVHRRSRRLAVLVAAVVALMAVTATAFAAENIAGWFKDYFAGQAGDPLTPGQIQFIEENEQIPTDAPGSTGASTPLTQGSQQLPTTAQSHGGYELKLKSVLSDSSTVYAIIGFTAPSGTTTDDLRGLMFPDVDFDGYCGYSIQFCDDRDGLDNTWDLLFELNIANLENTDVMTLRIDRIHQEIYEEGREYEQVVLAEGPWVFTIDLSKADNGELELLTAPVTAQACLGMEEDGTPVYGDVTITSFVLRPLSATIRVEAGGVPDFSDNAQRLIYAVMYDGSRIQLYNVWGSDNEAHLSAASPILLEEVDHILLADGSKIAVP